MEDQNNNQTNNSNSFVYNIKQTLPYSTSVLVCGIISISTCCCGLPGVVLGVISLVQASKAKKLYNENPEKYSVSSYKNMNAGFICAIIGTVFSAMFLASAIIRLITTGFSSINTDLNSYPYDPFQ